MHVKHTVLSSLVHSPNEVGKPTQLSVSLIYFVEGNKRGYQSDVRKDHYLFNSSKLTVKIFVSRCN